MGIASVKNSMELKRVYLYGIILSLMKVGLCIKCYQCDTQNNPACGVNFKSYQFDAVDCGKNEKCGLQRQDPIEEREGYVGILRRCYRMGDLPGINETDGCRYWTIRQVHGNFTAKYCFCSQDYCNAGTTLIPSYIVIAVLTVRGLIHVLGL